MSVSASAAVRTLISLIEKVTDDRLPIVITPRNGNAVLISEEDFASWRETIYLRRSPANARRLAQSVAEAERADTRSHEPYRGSSCARTAS